MVRGIKRKDIFTFHTITYVMYTAFVQYFCGIGDKITHVTEPHSGT